MTTAWVINAVGLFATTAGALLMFLYLWQSPSLADDATAPDVKRAYEKHRRLVMVGVGLLALSFVIQYIGVLI